VASAQCQPLLILPPAHFSATKNTVIRLPLKEGTTTDLLAIVSLLLFARKHLSEDFKIDVLLLSKVS